MTTIQESLQAELRSSNIADFAASFGALANPGLDLGPRGLASHPGRVPGLLSNFGSVPQSQPLQLPSPLAFPGAGPAAQPSVSASEGYHTQVEADPTTSTAVADALTALEASMQFMRGINATPEVRHTGPQPASSNDCSTRPSRKSARTSVEQTAGRSTSGKGLRHFSLRVCSAVESKGRTTYNEVADELVTEMRNEGTSNFDEKNVRRRVYDAINVLMAAGIMEKQKKDIIWMGFPNTPSKSLEKLEAERAQKMASVEAKQKHLQDLLEHHAGIKYLLQYNQQPSAEQRLKDAKTVVFLPFIIVKVKADKGFDCFVSEDYQNVTFDFNNASFEIHDDRYVVQKMMLAAASGPNQSPTGCATSSPALPVMSTGNSRQDSNVGNQAGQQVHQMRRHSVCSEGPSNTDAVTRPPSQ